MNGENKSWRNEAGVSFERYPKLNDELKQKGDSKTVVFLDDGKRISADVISVALKNKGIKGIKARDSIIFVVEDNKVKKELWIGATNYTNLRELAAIADNLTGQKVKITRIAEKDPEQANLKFEKA